MNLFRTNMQLESSENKITHKSKLLFLGSCFTKNIGDKLVENKFSVDLNPFGVLYNPLSVMNALNILLEKNEFNKNDLYKYKDNWLSFYHDTSFSDSDSKKCLTKINSKLNDSFKFFEKLDYLVITWGTIWTYKFTESGKTVSNCHKIPANKFSRQKLELSQIISDYYELIIQLRNANPELKIIFTVSPVRHWKDGAEQNQLSKSTLLLAIHELIDKFENIEYFPSYEIMMDDLRDYRFYTEDMLHPNKVAIDYIWDKFSDRYFDNTTLLLIKEISKIVKAVNHRPYNEESDSHQKFIAKQLSEIDKLKLKNSFLDFTNELEYLGKKLIGK